MRTIIHSFKNHKLLILLILIASFLRLSKIDTHGILFFDAAHDLLSASDAIKHNQLPLQGIASSRPWLHQGPLSIWISMLIMIVFGQSTLAQSITFSLLGIASIIVLYELLTIHVNKKIAYCAVGLLAVMPLAVAHSRVPYHTTPIPLVLALYLWALQSFWKKNSLRTMALAVFSALLLIQFELALVPLLVLLPFVFIRAGHRITKPFVFGLLIVTLLGLLPQIFLQLSGQSTTLIDVPKWIVHQLIEKVSTHTNMWQSTLRTLRSFQLFGGRLFGVDSSSMSIVGFVTTLTAFFVLSKKAVRSQLPPVIEITLAGFLISTIAYFLVGSPSEAYFPPYFIFVPILISYWISTFPKQIKKLAYYLLGTYIIFTTFKIITANYFVLNDLSFQYESVTENRQIARLLAIRSEGKNYQLATVSGIEVTIPAFFDHIRWFARTEQLAEPSSTGQLFYIEGLDQPQPAETIILRRFKTKTVYWSALKGEK